MPLGCTGPWWIELLVSSFRASNTDTPVETYAGGRDRLHHCWHLGELCERVKFPLLAQWEHMTRGTADSSSRRTVLAELHAAAIEDDVVDR